MSNLVELFDTISVDSRSLLSGEDVAAVEKIEGDYQKIVGQLKCWRTALSNLKRVLPGNPTEQAKLTRYGRHNIEHNPLHKSDNLFEEHLFTADYGLCYIENKLSDLLEMRANAVVDYFNERYGVRISCPSVKDAETIDAVLEYIQTEIGGDIESFKQKKVFEELRSKFNDGTVLEEKIIFPYIYWSRGSYGKEHYKKAFAFFEYGDFTKAEEFDLSATSGYTQLNGTKLLGYRPFRGGKFEITFSSHDEATRFYELFCIT